MRAIFLSAAGYISPEKDNYYYQKMDKYFGAE